METDEALLPIERRWLTEDPDDPRALCPNREQHAHRMYGSRWVSGGMASDRLDGRSVSKTHRQTLCEGCLRWMIWLPK